MARPSEAGLRLHARPGGALYRQDIRSLAGPHRPACGVAAIRPRIDGRSAWRSLRSRPGSIYADGYPSEDEALTTLTTWEDCKDCRKLLTYRDTCVGLAWVKGSEGRGTRFTALNPDSVAAREAARATCTAKTGAQACVAMVRCSGRAYIDGYPGEDVKSQ